ncbi:MAG: hypothetical protein LBQ52_10285 [Helicobacteraceae bacterium]|nr:hypothetical protein [Helicobacteraceae bacterium]
MVEQKEKSVLIAGNGPSLAAIDYRRLPRDIETWRVNEFYKEQKYYVGKRVDKYFSANYNQNHANGLLLALWLAASRGEYNMMAPNHFYVSLETTTFPSWAKWLYTLRKSSKSPDIAELYDYIATHKFNPRSGLQLIIIAALDGYKNIYIVGNDQFGDSEFASSMDYAWGEAHVSQEIMEVCAKAHTAAVQNKTIETLKKHPGVRLFSVSPSSPISRYIELAPIINEYPEGYTPPDKPSGFVNEIIKINAPQPPASPLEVRYEQLTKAVNDLKTEGVKSNQAALSAIKHETSNNIGRLCEQLSGIANKIDEYIAYRRKYPKWLVLFYCCFIPNKQKRIAIRKKYARNVN